jgi:hypothetical protein
MDLRDVLIFLSGAAAVKWWQWTTSRDRPRDEVEFHAARLRRKNQLARLTYRVNTWRYRLTGREWPRGWEEETARRWADRWWRAFL